MKRFCDILGALFLLSILSPLITILSLLILIIMGRPIFFTQERPGYKARLFKLIKFRTMSEMPNNNSKTLPDNKRLKPFGKLLRRTSLDELPELINVLKGDMSFVGPRPLLLEYLPYYNSEQARRHDVRPGITGLAQVRGRNLLTWEKKFELDVWYVDNKSLILDIKILFETIFVVIRGKGVSASGHATMPRFDEVNQKDERNN